MRYPQLSMHGSSRHACIACIVAYYTATFRYRPKLQADLIDLPVLSFTSILYVIFLYAQVGLLTDTFERVIMRVLDL